MRPDNRPASHGERVSDFMEHHKRDAVAGQYPEESGWRR